MAEYFGKRHDNVLQKLQNLECDDDFKALNFKGVKIIEKNAMDGQAKTNSLIVAEYFGKQHRTAQI